MKISVGLTELFKKYDSRLLEKFLDSFSIKFFIMASQTGSPGGSPYFRFPGGFPITVDENADGYYFYNKERDYMCAIYEQTEDEITDKFQRFLEIKAFV